jgi:hypothetical protein
MSLKRSPRLRRSKSSAIEALKLTLLLADHERLKYEGAALGWHARFAPEEAGVDMRESQAVLAPLSAIPRTAVGALAVLLSRTRGLERAYEVLVSWARGA